MIEFEWNRRKAKFNLEKHGVSFEEAQSVFFDEAAIQYFDDEHSNSEDRFIMLGMSIELRVLVVVHCECEDGNVIRISRLARQPVVNVNVIQVCKDER